MRVGLTEAADRKVRGYSGGMKRRLDLALALVHSPRILFLDEPTTGLDVQSRTALWAEVGRLARDEGVTVFLTTQYLEEADVLADRVGIIDHGRIVAEGTPAALKAEVGRPTIEATPADARDTDRMSDVLGRFGELVPCADGGVAARLEGGESELADVVRALDAESVEDRPSAAPPALPRRRLPCEDRPVARGRRRRGGSGRANVAPGHGHGVTGFADQVFQLGRRSVVRTLRQPANVDRATALPDAPARGQLGRAQGGDALAGLPDQLVRRLRAGGALHPGRAVRDHERRHRSRAGHPDRVPEPTLADAHAWDRGSRRPARRRDGRSGSYRRSSTSRSASSSASGWHPARPGWSCCSHS